VGSRSLESIRAEFPILAREVNGKPLSYLDNGATAQKPLAVIEAMDAYYREHNANVHRGVHKLSEEATDLYEGARASVASLIGAATREVAFTHNVTAAMNLVAHAWGDANVGAGDRIVLTGWAPLEHLPWYPAGPDRRGTRLGRDRRPGPPRPRRDVGGAGEGRRCWPSPMSRTCSAPSTTWLRSRPAKARGQPS
jgi:cysteine desulfurase/selenocysteine lyase